MIGKKNLHRRNLLAKWIPFAVLLIFSVVWLIPFVWAFGTSLKTIKRSAGLTLDGLETAIDSEFAEVVL